MTEMKRFPVAGVPFATQTVGTGSGTANDELLRTRFASIDNLRKKQRYTVYDTTAVFDFVGRHADWAALTQSPALSIEGIRMVGGKGGPYGQILLRAAVFVEQGFGDSTKKMRVAMAKSSTGIPHQILSSFGPSNNATFSATKTTMMIKPAVTPGATLAEGYSTDPAIVKNAEFVLPISTDYIGPDDYWALEIGPNPSTTAGLLWGRTIVTLRWAELHAT
jgi:hypothetical protein